MMYMLKLRKRHEIFEKKEKKYCLLYDNLITILNNNMNRIEQKTYDMQALIRERLAN